VRRVQGDELGLSTEKFLGEGVFTGYGQIDGRTTEVELGDLAARPIVAVVEGGAL
jgi:acetyl-CoA carboxylase carboxyltransferase component